MITRCVSSVTLILVLLAAWPAHSSRPVACAKYFAGTADLGIHVERRAEQPPALQASIDVYLRSLSSGDSGHVMAAQAETIVRIWRWLATVEPGVAPELRPSLRPRQSIWASIPQRMHAWLGGEAPSARARRLSLRELHDWQRGWAEVSGPGEEASQRVQLEIAWREIVWETRRIQSALPPPVPRSEDWFLLDSATPNRISRTGERLLRSVPDLLLLTDFEPYSIRDLNDLSPFPIYLVGFVRHIESADGLNFWPLPFVVHDLDHALEAFLPTFQIATSKVKDGTWSHARFRRYVAARAWVYSSFRRMAERVESAAVRAALDLVWLQIYHEQARHEMSSEGLLRALREGRHEVFSHEPGGIEGRLLERLRRGFFGQEQNIRVVQTRDVADALRLLEDFANTLPAWTADASLHD